MNIDKYLNYVVIENRSIGQYWAEWIFYYNPIAALYTTHQYSVYNNKVKYNKSCNIAYLNIEKSLSIN